MGKVKKKLSPGDQVRAAVGAANASVKMGAANAATSNVPKGKKDVFEDGSVRFKGGGSFDPNTGKTKKASKFNNKPYGERKKDAPKVADIKGRKKKSVPMPQFKRAR